jgi:hypothetical protein
MMLSTVKTLDLFFKKNLDPLRFVLRECFAPKLAACSFSALAYLALED